MRVKGVNICEKALTSINSVCKYLFLGVITSKVPLKFLKERNFCCTTNFRLTKTSHRVEKLFYPSVCKSFIYSFNERAYKMTMRQKKLSIVFIQAIRTDIVCKVFYAEHA